MTTSALRKAEYSISKKNGQNSLLCCGNGAPRAVGGITNLRFLVRPRRLETRSERGFLSGTDTLVVHDGGTRYWSLDGGTQIAEVGKEIEFSADGKLGAFLPQGHSKSVFLCIQHLSIFR